MTLALLVYSLAQRRLRAALAPASRNVTESNQSTHEKPHAAVDISVNGWHLCS